MEAYRGLHQHYKSKGTDKDARASIRVQVNEPKTPTTDKHAPLAVDMAPPPPLSESHSSDADSMRPQSLQSSARAACVSPIHLDFQDSPHGSWGDK